VTCHTIMESEFVTELTRPLTPVFLRILTSLRMEEHASILKSSRGATLL